MFSFWYSIDWTFQLFQFLNLPCQLHVIAIMFNFMDRSRKFPQIRNVLFNFSESILALNIIDWTRQSFQSFHFLLNFIKVMIFVNFVNWTLQCCSILGWLRWCKILMLCINIIYRTM